MTNKIISFLEAWRDLTRAIEAVLVDNLAATTPWLTPLIPAYLVWRSLVYKLGFNPIIAVLSAATVEFLGLAAVHTTFALWDYNDARRKVDQRAPVWVAFGASVFYLSVVLVVNLVLDGQDWREMLSLFLLSTLTAVAAVILAIRAQHARRLADIEQDKAERSERRKQAKAERSEIERETSKTESEESEGEQDNFACDFPECGYIATSQNALNGHKRKHSEKVVTKNGKAA